MRRLPSALMSRSRVWAASKRNSLVSSYIGLTEGPAAAAGRRKGGWRRSRVGPGAGDLKQGRRQGRAARPDPGADHRNQIVGERNHVAVEVLDRLPMAHVIVAEVPTAGAPSGLAA